MVQQPHTPAPQTPHTELVTLFTPTEMVANLSAGVLKAVLRQSVFVQRMTPASGSLTQATGKDVRTASLTLAFHMLVRQACRVKLSWRIPAAATEDGMTRKGEAAHTHTPSVHTEQTHYDPVGTMRRATPTAYLWAFRLPEEVMPMGC